MSFDPHLYAVIVDPDVQLKLESFRINNMVRAAMHYLCMGRQATDVGRCFADMTRLRREGVETWWEDAHAERFFRREGPELYLKDELYYDSEPRILTDDLRLMAMRRDRSRGMALPLDEERLAALGRLLPRLRSSICIADQKRNLLAADWELLEYLIDAEIVRIVERTPAPEAPENFEMRFVGHAGLCAETPTTKVLFDPLLAVRHRPELDFQHVLDRAPDAIAISHPHWDHFNFDSLLHVSRDTLFLLPALRNRPSIENIDMQPLLEELGFHRFERLQPWQTTQVGDIEVRATPFFGESAGPESNHDWMTFGVGLGGKRFFCAVDSCNDTQGSMDDVARRLMREHGRIDGVFAPVSSFFYAVAMFTRRPFYMGPGMDQYTAGPDDAVRWCTMVGADVLVPYASFVVAAGEDPEPDGNQRGNISLLRQRVRSRPHGPLCVLEPGQCLSWEAGGALRLPGEVRSAVCKAV